MNKRDPTPKIPMPIKAKPYKHQIEASISFASVSG